MITLLLVVVLYVASFCIAAVFVISAIILITTKPYPVIKWHVEEKSYNDPNSKMRKQFEAIGDQPVVDLTVVVPAYNEELRLCNMLDETLEFLEERQKVFPKYKYEIVVVSDGSTDGTVNVVNSYSVKYGTDKVKCLQLIENRGKGGAVRLGVLSSRGALILFADADGASKFEDITKLETALEDLLHLNPVRESNQLCELIGIAIGSRAHLEKESLATRSIFRNVLMYGFHFLVWLFTVKNIKDTQCGFKLFTREAAKICFESLHVTRWAFDVELLYIAQKLDIPIREVPIRWTEIDGSKITPVLSWIQMGLDLGLIWLKYKLGAWKIKAVKLE